MPVICLHWSEKQFSYLQQPNNAVHAVWISMIADCQNFPDFFGKISGLL
jgi:hypothetical protein